MPITKGAKKALRASDRKAVFNLRRKRVLKTEVKNIRDLIKEGKNLFSFLINCFLYG
jgi:ribosomal protein S20